MITRITGGTFCKCIEAYKRDVTFREIVVHRRCAGLYYIIRTRERGGVGENSTAVDAAASNIQGNLKCSDSLSQCIRN